MPPMSVLVRDENGTPLAKGDVLYVPGKYATDVYYNARIEDIVLGGDQVTVITQYGELRTVKRGSKLRNIEKSANTNTRPETGH